MSVEDNKNTVRRFNAEVLSKGNLSLVDEFMAPNYVNSATGGGVDSFKRFIGMMRTALPDFQTTVVDLVAEGDKVMARWTATGTYSGSIMGSKPTGKVVSARGITYYRFADGKIVEDDPVTTPDMLTLLGISMPPQD